MDVLVVGAGVVGCAVAWRLQQAGVQCTVLERSLPGAEASSAAAGILAPQVEADGPGPFLDLCLASRALYPDFARELAEVAGFEVGYQASGALLTALDDGEADEARTRVAWQRQAGLEAEWLDAAALRALEPALSPSMLGAARFAGDHQVDNRLLVKALSIAAAKSGARFVATQVRRLIESHGRVVGVMTDQGALHAAAVVVAAGAWTGLVPGALPDPSILRPARGQMAMVHTRAPLVRHVVFGAQGYAVPRADGRLLLGSTVEFVGFDKQVTAGGLAAILSRGIALIPAVADAPLVETWAGFRPHTTDGLPLLGAGARPGLFLASGHFRNGILLTPITAEVVRDLILERAPAVDITAFRADRNARKL